MNPGTIIIINGCSSSGKTSLIHALQDQLEAPYLEAGIDKFIWMLPKRYLDRPLWDDVLGLANKGGSTGHTLVKAMHGSIQAISQCGFNLIADHVLVEQEWVKDCVQRFKDLPTYLIGLFCSLEVLEEREKARQNRTLGQARLQFPVIHKYARYDLELDTSELNVSECVNRVAKRLDHPPRAISNLARMI